MPQIWGPERPSPHFINLLPERPEPPVKPQTTSKLSWTSTEVVSAFHQYWASNLDYISSKAAIYGHEIAIPKLHGDLIPIFHRLGYLDISLYGVENFVTHGDVHPIFSRANWITDLPHMDYIYQAMLPALRLATELIRCKRSSEWWLHVRHGKIVRQSHADSFLASTISSGTDYAPNSLAAEFCEFSKRVRFTWLAHSNMEDNHAFSLGSIPGLLQLLGSNHVCKFQKKRYLKDPNPIIVLPLQTLHRLLSLSTNSFTPCQNLRFQFLLAKTLIHELGHAWYTYWHGPLVTYGRRKRCQEPKVFESDIFPEMGFSLEWHIFGANLSTLDFGKNQCATVGPMVATRPQDDFPIRSPALAFVPMSWVRMWFQEETWKRFEEFYARGWLRSPTVDRHPQLYKIARYEDGTFQECIELYLEGDARFAVRRTRHECRTKGAIEARRWPSVAMWYEVVWEREGRFALEDGKLPESYCSISPTYAHLLKYCKRPDWMRGYMKERPFEAYVHRILRKNVDPGRITSKLDSKVNKRL